MSITEPTTGTTADPTTGAAAPVETIDLYRDIHKGIRAELFATTVQAGTVDPSDRQSRLDLATRTEGLVWLLETHAEHEDAGIQPAIEVHLPEVAERIVADHHALEARILGLRDMAATIADGNGAGARAAGQGLYVELAAFTSAYLAHQDLEERVVMPGLAAALGPELVLGIHVGILSSIPPADMARSLALMFPAMNVDDRTELLGGVQATAPAEVFAGIWGLFSSVVSPDDAAAVGARLGIDA
jgi:hypothetical protein